MKTKHTPGKWSIDGIDIVSENRNAICQVYDADDTHISEMNMDVVKANAQLIAAAPDLLEACITLIQQAEVCNYQTSDGLHQLLDNLAVKEIRAAIQKATG